LIVNNGPGLSVNAYYTSNIMTNLTNKYTQTNMGPDFTDPVRSFQMMPNYVSIYNYQLNSNNIPPIQNCLFNILSDFNIENFLGTNITSYLPTASVITNLLGYSDSITPIGSSFNFTIKLTAFINILPALYSFTIAAPDSSITLDPNSLFTIQYSELDWKYASYSCICTSTSGPAIYTAYCTSYYDCFTQNI